MFNKSCRLFTRFVLLVFVCMLSVTNYDDLPIIIYIGYVCLLIYLVISYSLAFVDIIKTKIYAQHLFGTYICLLLLPIVIFKKNILQIFDMDMFLILVIVILYMTIVTFSVVFTYIIGGIAGRLVVRLLLR